MTELTKQSSENLDYDFYYDTHFPSGDNVVSAQVIIIPQEYYSEDDDNIEIINGVIGENNKARLSIGSVSISGQVVKVFLSNGTDGRQYKVTCKATSNAGRVKEIDFKLTINDL